MNKMIMLISLALLLSASALGEVGYRNITISCASDVCFIVPDNTPIIFNGNNSQTNITVPFNYNTTVANNCTVNVTTQIINVTPVYQSVDVANLSTQLYNLLDDKVLNKCADKCLIGAQEKTDFQSKLDQCVGARNTEKTASDAATTKCKADMESLVNITTLQYQNLNNTLTAQIVERDNVRWAWVFMTAIAWLIVGIGGFILIRTGRMRSVNSGVRAAARAPPKFNLPEKFDGEQQ